MKKKNGLTSMITGIFGYILATLIVLFSGYNTFRLLYDSSANLVVATLGLVFFEGGMLFWWLCFQHDAEGLPQMAIALLVFGLCLLGVVIANVIELGAYELTLGSRLPQQLTVGAVIVQLVAKLMFPLVSPMTARKIKTKILEGQILQKADNMLDEKMERASNGIAETMSDNARDNLLFSLGRSTGNSAQPVYGLVGRGGYTEQPQPQAEPQSPQSPQSSVTFTPDEPTATNDVSGDTERFRNNNL